MRDYRFLPYEPEKPLLLPPDMRKWLPDDQLALFISDVVDTLDLTEITDEYLHLEGGHPAHRPVIVLKLLFYGYCVGAACPKMSTCATTRYFVPQHTT